ncbi:MAG: YciI family protein, partial [Sphingobacteriales bacterium]
MKKNILVFTGLLAFSVSYSQAGKTINNYTDTVKMKNQIRKYYFVMLLKGNNRSQDSLTAVKLQEGHMANISRLYYEGKLKVAGPFGDDGNWRGIFIFDCATEEEVRKLLDTDPAI